MKIFLTFFEKDELINLFCDDIVGRFKFSEDRKLLLLMQKDKIKSFSTQEKMVFIDLCIKENLKTLGPEHQLPPKRQFFWSTFHKLTFLL